MTSSKNNGFTASDIERYHSGKMSSQERHALEKAALDDPFLADALEGYAFTSTPLDDLKKIQSRLDEKSERKKVVPIFQRYKWLSVAAIVLMIAGAGWFAYSITKSENNSGVALQKNAKPGDNSGYTMPQQPIAIDSNTNKNATTKINDKLNDDKKQTTTPKKNHSTIKNNQKQKEDVALYLSKPKEEKMNSTFSKEKTSPELQNEVVSTQDKVPFNNGYLNNNKVVSTEPRLNKMAGRVRGFNVSNDSAQNNPAPITSTNDTIKNLNIVLHPLPMDSAQTLVLEQGAKRKSTEKYPHVTIDTLEPAEGYVNFDDYIAGNLQMPDEVKNKPAGEIQLSFDVDKYGQPTNITVVKSLCKKCDEEAIRLLKEGPKWKKKKNKKGKITIKF